MAGDAPARARGVEGLDPVDPARAYDARKAELSTRGAALDARERTMSLLRGVTFLGGIALVVLSVSRSSTPLGIAAGAAFAAFLAAVVAHALLLTKKAELDRRLALVTAGLARIRDEYQDFPERGERFSPEQHPYSKDLDIFGHRSLFQLLSTAETAAGRAALASWLLAGASAKVVAERQAAVRELSKRPDLREDLAVLAHEARAKLPPDALFAWGEAKSALEGGDATAKLAIAARFLAPVTVALAAASWTMGAALGPLRHAWIATVVVQLVVALRTGVMTDRALSAASSREEPLGRFGPVFARIEGASFGAPLLERCRAALLPSKSEAAGASAAMGRLQTILGFADLRHAGIVHVLVNLFTLWNLWCAVAIERWRARHGRRIRSWIEALSTLEALSSLATFAYEHPDYVYPAVSEGSPRFAATEMAHPLLPRSRRVANSVAFGTSAAVAETSGVRTADDLDQTSGVRRPRDLEASPQALLITGSNMSGKSTMLRAVGTNAVLALAGAPVCAAELSMSVLDVRTSMRITDSLEQGVSHFYAELSRLKEITVAAEAGGAVLFLLDEILHGTNSRERQIGAKAVVRHLLVKGAIGAVSSHDLGLASLEDETGGAVKNAHFEEHVEDGKMAFDYRLKSGVVTTTNALRLMRVVGLPVDDE